VTRPSDLRAARARRFEAVDLYPVTGARHSAGRSTLTIIDAVREAGCRAVQLREKELSKATYLELARQVRARSGPELLLICNDHLDVALAAGADGVHLGQHDLPVAAARALAPDLLLGVSTHTLEQALAAQAAGADYVNIGPIFATQTKAGVRAVLGPSAIGVIAPALSIPFTVMGGIKEHNLEQVLEQGARRVAVVTAVTAAENPATAARRLRALIRS
jgi:thiamine-phosphate pyrophosphorylase